MLLVKYVVLVLVVQSRQVVADYLYLFVAAPAVKDILYVSRPAATILLFLIPFQQPHGGLTNTKLLWEHLSVTSFLAIMVLKRFIFLLSILLQYIACYKHTENSTIISILEVFYVPGTRLFRLRLSQAFLCLAVNTLIPS